MSENSGKEAGMSERTHWTPILLTIIGCICLTYWLALRDGEQRMKRWQDDWYAAHPVLQQTCGFQISEAPRGYYGISIGCDGSTVGPVLLPEPPAPKPSKGSKPRTEKVYPMFREDCTHAPDTRPCFSPAETIQLYPEVKPAPPIPCPSSTYGCQPVAQTTLDFTKCDCKDYGMGLICTCPVLMNSIVPAAKP